MVNKLMHLDADSGTVKESLWPPMICSHIATFHNIFHVKELKSLHTRAKYVDDNTYIRVQIQLIVHCSVVLNDVFM